MQIHNFALDPVAHVDEGILQFLAEAVQLELEVGLVVAGHETHVVGAAELNLALIVTILVLGQEVRELLVVLQLRLFHGHDLLDVHLELLQMANELILLLLELDYVATVFSQVGLGHIQLRQLDVAFVVFEHVVRGLSLIHI